MENIVPIFADKAQFQDCITGIFLAMRADPQIGPRVQATGLVVRFSYAHPDTFVIVDCRQTPISVEWDKEPTLSAEERSKIYIEMTMEADTGHVFWLGRLNLVAAITRGLVKAKGPIPSIMRLLPIIKPAFALYPNVLADHGLAHLAQ
jgi:hypothetical protein